jgi:hypothetical protein
MIKAADPSGQAFLTMIWVYSVSCSPVSIEKGQEEEDTL